MTIRNSSHLTLTGWPAVVVFVTMGLTKALTILVLSLPVAWLANRVFAVDAIHVIFGADRLSYWRCVGLFAIWHSARLRIKISGRSQVEIAGNR